MVLMFLFLWEVYFPFQLKVAAIPKDSSAALDHPFAQESTMLMAGGVLAARRLKVGCFRATI
jgi:hypothetical protein